MISFNEACKIAFEHFIKRDNEIGLSKALETKNAWIFYAGKEGINKVGNTGLLVYKHDGIKEDFVLPSKKNFLLLQEAIPIKIDEEFLF